MIDLNHGSGCQYEAPSRPPGVGVAINAAIDAALVARNRAQAPRHYVSTSGLGRECLRQIQYDYLAVPKDDGRDFEPRTLRMFEAGHRAEDIVAAWLRAAGFDLRTHRRTAGSSASRHSTAAFAATSTAASSPARRRSRIPALWENKALGAASWKDVVKRGVVIARPVYAAQIALYRPTSTCPTRRCSPRSTATPSSSTANWCRSTPRSRRRERPRRAGRARERSARAAAARRRRQELGALPRWQDRRRMARRLCLAGPLLEGAGMTDITPSDTQARAIAAIKDWFKQPDQGAAGVPAVRLCRHRKVHRPEIRARRTWARSAQEQPRRWRLRARRRDRHLHRQGRAGAAAQGHAGPHHPQPDLQRHRRDRRGDRGRRQEDRGGAGSRPQRSPASIAPPPRRRSRPCARRCRR